MGYLWLTAIVVSIVLTAIFASHFKLKRLPSLTVLNIICPFAGLFYAMYVVHVIVPKVIKQEYGQDIESPLKPYFEIYKAKLLAKWEEIKSQHNKDDDKTL